MGSVRVLEVCIILSKMCMRILKIELLGLWGGGGGGGGGGVGGGVQKIGQVN